MNNDTLQVTVAEIKQVAPTIKEFTLKPVSGALSPFSPGSHVVVTLSTPDKTIKNAYSLLSDPFKTDAYRIAVRLQDNSRGGSEYLHQSVKKGDLLTITPPANLFAPDWGAKKHLLIAGGVGITPFMSYIPELMRRGADFELHYLYRSEQTGAYAGELANMLGEQCFSYDSAQGTRCDLNLLLAGQPIGTHIYICGPESLTESVKEIAANTGLPMASIHYEAFAAPKPGKPFTVEIKSSGQQVEVAAEQSLLEALEAAEIHVPNLCRGGVCGQCACGVESGEIDHRDDFLSPVEKSSQQQIMPCVSRAKSDRLVLTI